MSAKTFHKLKKAKFSNDIDQMNVIVHHVNADKEIKKEINTNLFNLVNQMLNAWEKDDEEEVKRLENLAVAEILSIHVDMDNMHDRPRALTWLYTTLYMFQKKTWVPKVPAKPHEVKAAFKDVKVGCFFYLGDSGNHYKKDSETVALFWPSDNAPHPRVLIEEFKIVRVNFLDLK